MGASLFRGNLAALAGLLWLAFAVLAVVLAARSGGPTLITDDALRLVQVRDLLGGQSWFDLTQHRLDAPYGLAMHWTRPVDAGVAGLILLFRLFTTHANAETAALYVWPLLTFFFVLLALARIANRIGGREAGVIVLLLTVTCVNVLGDFAPGSIDHHNLLLAVTLWTVAFLLEARERPWAGAWAALACASTLMVGMEVLPYAVVAIAVLGIFWLRDGAALAPAVRRFGVGLGASALLFLFAVTDTRYRFTAACDTYSSFYAILLTVGGFGLAAIASFGNTMATRACLLAGVGVVALGCAAFNGAACFAGPYAAMDPRLTAIWLSRITEAQSAFTFAHYATSEFVASYVYAVAGSLAAVSLWFIRRDTNSGVLAAFTIVALLVATVQIRAASYAILLGLPAIAALLAWLLPRLASRRALGTVAGALALLLSCDASFAFVGGALVERNAHLAERIARFNAEVACGSPQGMAPLASLPPGRVASFVDQGPAVLAFTRSAAIAGPYHRDADGILDSYAIFTAPARTVAAILKRRGIAYVMTCSASRDWDYYRARSAPDGLLVRTPSWLVPAGVSGDVRVYRIKL